MKAAIYVAELRATFAFYGFPASPLSEAEMIECHTQGLTLDQAYSVGCDVASGWPFADAMMADA